MPANLRTAPRPKVSYNNIKWFHRIDLGNGVITPGYSDDQRKLIDLHFPEDLSGKTFLDIGAWDGFYSFEAEKRGAKRVLATDSFVWQGNVPWASKAGFDFAKHALNSGVEEMLIDHTEFSPERMGMWDIVFFSGVLYHVQNPMLSLERVASVCKELLIVETETDLEWHLRPAVAFYPGNELEGDVTNWCGPNTRWLKSMLKLYGFNRIEVKARKSLAWKAYCAVKWQDISAFQRNRVVIHAYR